MTEISRSVSLLDTLSKIQGLRNKATTIPEYLQSVGSVITNSMHLPFCQFNIFQSNFIASPISSKTLSHNPELISISHDAMRMVNEQIKIHESPSDYILLENYYVDTLSQKNYDVALYPIYLDTTLLGINAIFGHSLHKLHELLDLINSEIANSIQSFIKFSFQQKAIKQLESEKSRLQSILYSITDAVILVDPSLKISMMNPIAEKLTGSSLINSIGKSINEVLDLRDEKYKVSLISPIVESILEGKTLHFTNHPQIVSKTGQIWAVAISVSPIKPLDGITNGAVIVFRDQGKEREKKRILEESESLLRQSQKVAKIGHYIYDIPNDHFDCSDALMEVFGIDDTFERDQHGWYGLIHPEHREEMQNYFVSNVLGKGEPFKKEYKIIKQNSKECIWVLGLGDLHFDESGGPTEMFGTIQDISDRKFAEENLRISEERLKIALKSSNDAVWDYDLLTNTMYHSTRWWEMLGYDPINYAQSANSTYDMMHPDDKKRILNAWNAVIASKEQNFQLEFRLMHKQGYPIPILMRASVIRDEFGKGTRIVGINTDMTERKKYEDELIQAKERAEESARLKSSFLANMSHEIRTPFIGILGYTEILREELTDKEQIGMINTIHRAGKRLLETLNSILDFSKLEANKLLPEIEEFDIVALSQEVVQLFEKTSQKMQVNLSVACTEDSIFVRCDVKFIRYILNNLVSNSVKFTDKGSITVGLEKSIIDEKEFVIISVADTGIGIPAQNLEIIFDEFRQSSEGLGRVFEGTGLGLTIARRLTHILNGTISVESTVGKGTTFTVCIPMSQP